MSGKTNRSNSYETIRREIAESRVSPAYLFHGEENYLKEAAVGLLRSLISPGAEDFNLFVFDGAGFEPEILVDAVETLPSFSEKKLIILRDFNISSPPQKYAAALERIFENPPDYSVMVFLHPGEFSPPRAASRPPWFNRLEILEFTRPEASAIYSWVMRRFKAGGRECRRDMAEYLCYVNGGMMEELIPEIEKLCAFRPGAPVTREDIDLVATRSIEADIYDINDALCAKNPREALKICSELLENRIEPVAVLNSLSRAARQMYGAKLIAESGRNTKDLMELFGLRFPFIADRLIRNARNFSKKGLARWITLCLDADRTIKTTMRDDGLTIERLIAEMAMVK